MDADGRQKKRQKLEAPQGFAKPKSKPLSSTKISVPTFQSGFSREKRADGASKARAPTSGLTLKAPEGFAAGLGVKDAPADPPLPKRIDLAGQPFELVPAEPDKSDRKETAPPKSAKPPSIPAPKALAPRLAPKFTLAKETSTSSTTAPTVASKVLRHPPFAPAAVPVQATTFKAKELKSLQPPSVPTVVTSEDRDLRAISRTKLAIATDLSTESGAAEVAALALYARSAGLDTSTLTDELRGVHISPEKKGKGKKPKYVAFVPLPSYLTLTNSPIEEGWRLGLQHSFKPRRHN